ncbi:hypothetical protein VNO77_03186 [Canavalia gladiata]|uniref:Uncharacterized protein n=1 Tax=Canavalia gladiata TaxID=3824 RepID=A0AAN9R6L1_CANGL
MTVSSTFGMSPSYTKKVWMDCSEGVSSGKNRETFYGTAIAQPMQAISMENGQQPSWAMGTADARVKRGKMELWGRMWSKDVVPWYTLFGGAIRNEGDPVT